jgi:hypothetical protein
MQTFTQKQRSFATHSRFLHNFSLNRMKLSQTEYKFMPLDGENMEFSGSEMGLQVENNWR